MGRPIDADALKEEIEFHPTSVSVCMTVAEAKGQTYFKRRCLEDIDNAPTIDAIPVEWLIQMQDKLRSAVAAHSNISGNSMDILQAISAVLELWEQEAR